MQIFVRVKWIFQVPPNTFPSWMDISKKNSVMDGACFGTAYTHHPADIMDHEGVVMERMFEKVLWKKVVFPAILFATLSLMFSGFAFANMSVENDVIIIGKNYVRVTPYDDRVVFESKKGAFKERTFHGVEGTAAMLFLYNRITRDMGIDLVLNTYKDRIDRKHAEETVDLVLKFYKDNELIFRSKFEEKPATKIGIQRFRI